MQTLQGQNMHRPYHDEHLYVDLREEVVILHGETVWFDSPAVPPVGCTGGARRGGSLRACATTASRIS